MPKFFRFLAEDGYERIVNLAMLHSIQFDCNGTVYLRLVGNADQDCVHGKTGYAVGGDDASRLLKLFDA